MGNPGKQSLSQKTSVAAPLPPSFFQGEDVVDIARCLLGKHLFTKIEGEEITGGIITETEAYRGPDDRACHAYQMRRTRRTEVMFHAGGIAYVYLCYGIHALLNIVTGKEDMPHAVLIRSIIPTHGEALMRMRRRGRLPLAKGPGTLTQALGLTVRHNGLSLTGPQLWIEEGSWMPIPDEITTGPRVGIEYAGEDALLPWRFQLIDKSFRVDVEQPPSLQP